MYLNTYSLKLVREKRAKYDPIPLRTPENARRLMRFMEDLSEEHVFVVYLDAKLLPTGIHLVSKGTLNASLVHPREVFKGALLANAYSILLAHNHPSGDPTPSKEDLETTEKIREAGVILGISLMDHLVITNTDWRSIREHHPELWSEL